MPIETKVTLLKEIEHDLASEVTVKDMSKILSVISDKLQLYDLIQVEKDQYSDHDDLFDAYISAIRIEGRSPQTIYQYSYRIKKFMEFVGVPTRCVTVYHVRKYLESEKDRGISDSTLDSYRQKFSSYFGWLWRENLIERNPMANIGVIKVPKREKETISETDFELLKNGARTLRDKAILCFLNSSACRISEMTSLNIEDIDLVNNKCTVIGKGNKQRVVYINPVTSMLIMNYLHTRTDDNPALFLGQRKNRFTNNGVRMMLRTLAKKLNVEHIHPHKFRRTKITELVKRGMPIEQVREIAGHEKIDTTLKYVVMDKTQVESSYRRYA